MEPKRTKSTPKPGEIKPSNPLLRTAMIKISNNSIMTNNMVKILSQKLDNVEMKTMLEWLKHAQMINDIKVQQAKRKF